MPMELIAFARMLDDRKRIITSQDDEKKTIILFKLYPYLTCSPSSTELLEEHDGDRYLRVDCMSDA